jgi:hypothetical protein
MPYIPERRYEDKPDIFTPFVPMDPETKVEVCDTQFDNKEAPQVYKQSMFNKKLLYICIILALLYYLKK